MPDQRIRLAGTVQDVHGDDIEIGIVYDAAAGRDPGGELPVIMIGHGIELGQEEAGEFARVFASACREAARQVPGD